MLLGLSSIILEGSCVSGNFDSLTKSDANGSFLSDWNSWLNLVRLIKSSGLEAHYISKCLAELGVWRCLHDESGEVEFHQRTNCVVGTLSFWEADFGGFWQMTWYSSDLGAFVLRL